ncbi:hypothetical protein [Lacrimispora sp.]|uniref:hypothetical protein n=1 Tax=Lacrimispora sp. TaxID=2719234 RepID=UPI0028A69ED4|nr:hypothetical protein [Lacrimispora sp.]
MENEIVDKTKNIFLEDSELLRNQLKLLAEKSAHCPDQFISEYSEQMVKIFTVLHT